MVDELEESTPAQRALLAELAVDNPNHLYALEAPERTPGRSPSPESEDRGWRPPPPARGGRGRCLVSRSPPRGRGRRARVAGSASRGSRFWSCANERAQAQATRARGRAPARGRHRADGICVLLDDPVREGGAVAAAMEERGIPFHLSGPAALFQRAEVRDAIAWLRVLADPDDSAAAARALTRPPVELRPGDLARLTTISRRRKLDMVAACEAALDSPQIQPEARERIQSFLKLYRAAAAAMEERRADVFVRRLIERGRTAPPAPLRRPARGRRAAARALAAGRAGGRLGAARAARVDPRLRRLPQRRRRGRGRADRRRGAALARRRARPCSSGAVKGLEFDHVFALGLEEVASGTGSAALRAPGWSSRGSEARAAAPCAPSEERRRLSRTRPRRTTRRSCSAPPRACTPPTGCCARRCSRHRWRAGRELSEPRLDTAIDVNRAIARYLELLKLAALAQRPGEEATAEAIEAVNGLLRQVATPEQQAELDASSLDSYLLDSESERGPPPAADRRPRGALAGGLPAAPRRRPRSASRPPTSTLYLTCPLKYKFARVFGIPQEPTINQRFGILMHNVLERFHKEPPEEGDDGLRRADRASSRAGWRRSRLRRRRRRAAVPRPGTRGAAPLLGARTGRRVRAGLAGAQVRLPGRRPPRARPRRPGRPPARRRLRADRLQDRRAQDRGGSRLRPAAGALPAGGARGLGHRGRRSPATTTCSTPRRLPRRSSPTTPSGSSGPWSRSARASSRQDFEPRPSPTVCGWCDYRLICPAAES